MTPVRKFGRGNEETCLLIFYVLCQIRHLEQKYEVKADVRECSNAETFACLPWLPFLVLVMESYWIVKLWQCDWTQHFYCRLSNHYISGGEKGDHFDATFILFKDSFIQILETCDSCMLSFSVGKHISSE